MNSNTMNVTHPFRRVLGSLASARTNITFCSWNAEDCNGNVATNVSLADDCMAINFQMSPEDLDGALCCKSMEEAPFIVNIPVCIISSPAKVFVLLVLLAAIVIVCAKSIRDTYKIFRKSGCSTFKNNAGKCVLICAVAQVFFILYTLTVFFAYLATLSGAPFGFHASLGVGVVLTLPTSLSFSVFAALSMAFNIITVGRTAAMQGFDEKNRNANRLTRLHRIITAATITYSALFFAATFNLALGNFIILGAVFLESIFQAWLFRSAAKLMHDLNVSIGNDAASRDSRSNSNSVSESGRRSSAKQNTTENKMHDSLLRLQQSSSFISKSSAFCAILLAFRIADEFVKFEGNIGFNPVHMVGALLQNFAILFLMFNLNSITSTLYKNKMQSDTKKKNKKGANSTTKIVPSEELFSANSAADTQTASEQKH